MALPEGYRPRAKDIIMLRGIVAYDVDPDDKDVHVKIEGSHASAVVKLTDVESLVCRAWKKNEEVQPIHRSTQWEKPGVVLHTSGEWAWVADPDGTGPMTYHSNALEPWRDPKAPLVAEEEAVKALDAVSGAMQEPAGGIAFEDDEGPGAVLMPQSPPPPAPGSSAVVGDTEKIKRTPLASDDEDDMPF